ncbi:uncharacterized protein LOC6570141 [Drosophila grimshawi]|uniref:GH25110 n=1 Tax=Drosophila grimshawi TaxID=7222 RepID=B4JZB7_DROGR|nr:uncharacterized protein LOC6570141 [Drosophila grimshawi]EDV94039.1 GH25110 [Drosophila grimshawi]
MSEPFRGLPQSVRSYYLQLFGAALVSILISVLLLHLVGQLHDVVVKDEDCCIAAMVLFVLGLTTLCIYVNVIQLRRKFPVNWIICCSIALLLALGNSFLLAQQDSENLLLTLEVLSLMCLFLLLGYWLPAHCPPLIYIGLTSLIVLVLVCIILSIISHLSEDDNTVAVHMVHGVMWVCMCPMLVFQSQVINGHLQNVLPVLDIPLCSLLLLIDFMACYAFVEAADDIIMAVQLVSSDNRRIIYDGIANMLEEKL